MNSSTFQQKEGLTLYYYHSRLGIGESQALWMKPRSRLVTHGSPQLPFLPPVYLLTTPFYSISKKTLPGPENIEQP